MAGSGQQRLVRPIGEQQVVAARSDIPHVEREGGREFVLYFQTPFLPFRNPEIRSDYPVSLARGRGSYDKTQGRGREWLLECGRTIAGPCIAKELGKWLCIAVRSIRGVSCVRGKLIEPSITAAYNHTVLFAAWLPS